MPDWSDFAGAWKSLALEDRRDRPVADPLVEHLEDALHDRRRLGIGLECPEFDAGGGLLTLRVRDLGVDKSVAVVRSTAKPAPNGTVGEGSPTADFFDAVDEVLRFRITAQGGAQALAHGSVEGEDVNARQASWERIELGRSEVVGDFGWLNGATLVSLHGAVDALVEGVGPANHRLRARIASMEIVRKGLRDHPELAADVSDDMDPMRPADARAPTSTSTGSTSTPPMDSCPMTRRSTPCGTRCIARSST